MPVKVRNSTSETFQIDEGEYIKIEEGREENFAVISSSLVIANATFTVPIDYEATDKAYRLVRVSDNKPKPFVQI